VSRKNSLAIATPLRWRLLRCGGFFLAIVFGLLLLVDRWLPYALLSHHNHSVDLSQRPAQEQLSVTAADGTVTQGWLIPAPGREGDRAAQLTTTLILLHGLGANRQAVLDLGLALQQEAAAQDIAMAIALMDLRGHGESGGAYFTYGYHEAQDLTALLDELERQNAASTAPDQSPRSYALLGLSAGGAVAIAAAAQDDRIDALITVGTFADLAATAKTQTALLPDVWRDRVLRRAEAIAQFDIAQAAPAYSLARVRAPVLIAHGDQDGYIPFSNAEQLYAAAATAKQIYAIPGAGHADMLSEGGKTLHRETIQFLSAALSNE